MFLKLISYFYLIIFSHFLFIKKLLEEKKYSYLIIESFENVGGACKNIYPHKYMYDIRGLGPITGGEFIDVLLNNINQMSKQDKVPINTTAPVTVPVTVPKKDIVRNNIILGRIVLREFIYNGFK